MNFLRNAVIGVGGAAAIGFGVYYTIHLEELAGLEYKYKQAKRTIDKETADLKQAERQLSEQESLIAVLTQQGDVELKSAKAVESKLTALRSDLTKLEAEYRSKQAAVAKLQKEIAQAKAAVRDLTEDTTKRRNAMTMAEQSLKEVQRRVDEQKTLLNPLNHPKVKELMGK